MARENGGEKRWWERRAERRNGWRVRLREGETTKGTAPDEEKVVDLSCFFRAGKKTGAFEEPFRASVQLRRILGPSGSCNDGDLRRKAKQPPF